MNKVSSINGPATQSDKTVRILSVAGGGLLGVIPAAFLSRYEQLGRASYGDAYRLCESFDLVGGASTGAIIATAIAMGCEVSEISSFYLVDAPDVFARPRLTLPGLSPRFNSDRLMGHFARCTEGRRLRRSDLATDLAVVVRDMEAGRQILMSSAGRDGDERLNATIRRAEVDLARLLRATTAAPGFFAPQSLPIGAGGRDAICIDGALGTFADPAPLMWQSATAAGAPWAGCRANVLSLGTGAGQPKATARSLSRGPSAVLALRALSAMIRDSMTHSVEMMQTLARYDPRLDFKRLDMSLEGEIFSDLGMRPDRKTLRQMRRFDDCRGKQALFDAALRWAEREITAPLPLAGDARTLSPCRRPAA